MADKTYEVKGRTIRLQIDDAMVAIRFKENLQTSRRAAAVERPGVEAFSRRLELPREPFTVLPLTRLEGARSAAEEAEELAANDDVVRVTPVFKIGDKHAIATERLSLGLKEGQDPAVMADIKRTYDLETLEEFGDREFMMRVPPGEDPVDVAARLGGDDRIDYAEPDLVIFGTHVPRPPSASNGADPTMTGRGPRRFSAGDPLLAHQYAIPITETDLAWRMARGASDIRIAILDEGVDTDHPDLKEAIVGSYDAIDNDEWQEPQPWDAHGTACAGLAAAVRVRQEQQARAGGVGEGAARRVADVRGGPPPAAGAEGAEQQEGQERSGAEHRCTLPGHVSLSTGVQPPRQRERSREQEYREAKTQRVGLFAEDHKRDQHGERDLEVVHDREAGGARAGSADVPEEEAEA